MKKIMMMMLLAAILSLRTPASYAFDLNGFASVSYSKYTAGADGSRNGDFTVGDLDLFLAESMDDIEILSELVLEDGSVDVERLTIGYTFSDELKIRAGRFHTPLGFWNTSYHHGVQLQPTIDRPEFLKFEDDHGILPTHLVGIYFSGRTNTALGGVEYGVMFGNGSRITSGGELDPNMISDNNVGKAIAFNVAISPDIAAGLKVGASGNISNISNKEDNTSPTVSVDQTILNSSISYTIANIDLIGEYFHIRDKDVITSKGSFDNNAYYGLIKYTYKDTWVPYLLWEHFSAKEDDPYLIALDGAMDATELIAGLRYNINYRSSLKGEVRRVKEEVDSWNEYAVQWALAF